MAERPVFLPCAEGDRLVREVPVAFTWNRGMAPSQKKKNIVALHAAAAKLGLAPLLEVSTKSEELLGQRLSAFALKVDLPDGSSAPLECVFQGSKVFSAGGPFTDLYLAQPGAAKRDSRLVASGALVAFDFAGVRFPLEPKTAFYDWLYVRALLPHRDYLLRLRTYAGFTDIEFNPERSVNCQARSCAAFVSLEERGLLQTALESPKQFRDILGRDAPHQPHSSPRKQGTLF